VQTSPPTDPSAALAAFDPRSAAFAADPYPVFDAAREAGEPLWHEDLQLWLAFRHADASATLRAKTLGRIFRPRAPEQVWGTFNWLHADSILDSEPPKHTRLRRLVSKAFTRSYIETLRPQVEAVCADLLDAAAAKERAGGTVDLISDYAEPLPVRIIAAMLGIPAEDQRLLRPWSQDIVKMYEYDSTPAHEQAARRSSEEFARYVADLAEQRRKDPTDDLVTQLVQVHEGSDRLSSHELIATCVLLLNAGHEASVNGSGNGLVAAFATGQADRLRADPWGTAPTAVEEFLRYDAPLQLFERTATADTQVGGCTVREGQRIAALLGSANRDPEVFDRADEMDLGRDPNPHIGFGMGTHFCLGAPLARMELTTSVAMLFERFPEIAPAGSARLRPTFVLRGYRTVPVRLAGRGPEEFR
jgi:cytochrome P450